MGYRAPLPRPLPFGERESFFGFDHLTAGVVSAVSTDRVRSRQLLAVRAGLELHVDECQVRTPATLLRFGELDLRQSHGCRILPDRVRSKRPGRSPQARVGWTAAPRRLGELSPACGRDALRAASAARGHMPRPGG